MGLRTGAGNEAGLQMPSGRMGYNRVAVTLHWLIAAAILTLPFVWPGATARDAVRKPLTKKPLN